MMGVEKWKPVSVQDYLDSEEVSPLKREYCEGLIFEMPDFTNRHNEISGNALGHLHSQLRGKTCRPWNSSTKIRIRLTSGTRFYYPDAFVVCNPNPANDTYHDAPIVVLEVTSPSSRRIDLGEKMDAYLAIPTLMVYLIAESTEPVVQVYRRSPNGDFHRELAIGLESIISLPEIGATLSLADLYD